MNSSPLLTRFGQRRAHTWLLWSLLALSATGGFAAEAGPGFARESKFGSVRDFVERASRFNPARELGYLGFLFAVPELGQPEEDHVGRMTLADAVSKPEILWQTPQMAAVFVLASPKISATKSEVGVLFILLKAEDAWRITDLRRTVTYGGLCELSCKQTAGRRSDQELDRESPPVFVFTKTEGGRGYAYTASFTLRLNGLRLEPVGTD